MTIYNLMGTKVFQMPLNPETALNTVKLGNINPGLYLIKVENCHNEIFITKIIIQQQFYETSFTFAIPDFEFFFAFSGI